MNIRFNNNNSLILILGLIMVFYGINNILAHWGHLNKTYFLSVSKYKEVYGVNTKRGFI